MSVYAAIWMQTMWVNQGNKVSELISAEWRWGSIRTGRGHGHGRGTGIAIEMCIEGRLTPKYSGQEVTH